MCTRVALKDEGAPVWFSDRDAIGWGFDRQYAAKLSTVPAVVFPNVPSKLSLTLLDGLLQPVRIDSAAQGMLHRHHPHHNLSKADPLMAHPPPMCALAFLFCCTLMYRLNSSMYQSSSIVNVPILSVPLTLDPPESAYGRVCLVVHSVSEIPYQFN